ncbi:MAG: hypothetical protein ABL958_10105 [Bdellovibrionia bacterium]
MKWLGLLSLVLVLGACGNDGKNDRNQTAQVPAYGANCVQNGGYGCQQGNYPGGMSAYPTQNGYYAGYYACNSAYSSCGYSYNNNANYFSACGQGTVAAYSPYYGLVCVQAYQQISYYYYRPQVFAYYSYGGYYALQYCTVAQTSCGVGTVCATAGGGAWGFCSYGY